jgi:Rps23 Pro-64 3,4-dihydroxylase Tpa1-like proline 4-hydroxylase
MNKEILAPGIHSYKNVFEDSINHINKIESLVSSSQLSWIPSFNKNHTSEEDAKKFFRNLDTIGLPIESQIPENIDKDKEPARTLLDFSSSLNNEFSVYLKDYVEEYGISLSEQEPFGLLKYGKGQKFDKHIDNGMMFVRNVSLVYYANNTYTGGEIFFDRFNLNIKPEKNQLLIFPSNYIYSHSISEVLEGTRYSIVTWYK